MLPNASSPKRPEDPFADQLEWLVHRYDPGHYLGGTIRPELRQSLGSRAKRFAAVWAFVSGVGPMCLVIWLMAGSGQWLPDPWSFGAGVLGALAAVKLWKSADRDARAASLDWAEEGRRFYKVVGMVALCTLVTAVVSLILISGAAAATAIVKGRAGVFAGAGVLVVMVLLRWRSVGR